MITTLILPDGREISSGNTGEAAVMRFDLTAQANTAVDLEPGACCAAMAQITLVGAELGFGEEIQIFRDGIPLGYFTLQRPTRTGPLLKITAYDRVARLDQSLRDWLGRWTGFPCTLEEFAHAVCAACGLELVTEPLPEITVEQFTGDYTGRQLMQWVGQAAGCFCAARPDGKLELRWFIHKSIPVEKGDIYENSLIFEDYTTKSVEKVRICTTDQDVGVVYPNITGGNTYTLRGNPLLNLSTTGTGETVARRLYERLQLSYTPCRFTVAETLGLQVGDIITVDGKTVVVMALRNQAGKVAVECTGNPDRAASAALNNLSYKELSGRVLELSAQVTGLRVENRDKAGQLSRLSLEVEGIAAEVSGLTETGQQRMTRLEQTARDLQIRIDRPVDQVTTSTGYTFGSEGLRIAKSGTEMENRLDHTGMYVTRGGQTILRADHRGVQARDVQVENYLNIGKYARFEDYGGRTACFYIEGGA